MGGNKVGDKLLFQIVFAQNFVIYLFKLVKMFKSRFAHHFQYAVRGVFGGYFQPSGSVARNELFEVFFQFLGIGFFVVRRHG